MKLYSIRDHAAGTFGAPFHAPNDALALRLFEQVQLDENHVWSTHPTDFQVHYCGEFDEIQGEWNMLPRPTPILTPLPKKKDL